MPEEKIMPNDFCVYIHTFPNGKVYVGVTKQSLTQRWRDGRGYKDQIRMKRAIQKHGWDNIAHDVLLCGASISEAAEAERKYIKLFNSANKDFGYNVSLGGNLPAAETVEKVKSKLVGKKHSDEIRLHMSEGGRGKIITEEHRAKLGIASKKMWESEEYRKKYSAAVAGRKLSEEHKQKIRNANTGKPRTESQLRALRKPVCQCDYISGEVVATWASMTEAANKLGIHKSKISEVCRGNRKKCGGYTWKFVEVQ